MKYKIELDDEDYIQYNTFLLLNTNSGKSAIMRGRLLGFAISALVMLVLVIAKADKGLILAELAMLAVFSIGVFFFYPRSAVRTMQKRILKLKEEGKLAYVPESTLDFREDEIFEVTPDGERHIRYGDLMSVDETEEYIYLRKGAQEALVLPKRCLTGKGQELLSFLETRVKIVNRAGADVK